MRALCVLCLLMLGSPTAALSQSSPLPGGGTASPAPAAPPATLTLEQAEQLALKNNPRITETQLLALAQRQVTREVRSAELPTLNGNLTAVDPHPGTRLAAGGLSNSSVFERAAGGVSFNQLITDFGRTRSLTASAASRAQAAQYYALATAAEITLAVDQTFYRALSSQAELRVAQQTVTARQTTAEQISALTSAKLRSTLDASFAALALSQARLLLLDAENNHTQALAALSALLGNSGPANLVLTEDNTPPPLPPEADPEPLVAKALAQRPDLLSLDEQARAAQQFSRAEHDLWRPSLSAIGATGGTPVRDNNITSSWYGAIGANLSVPLFNGFLYDARAKEADLRSRAADARVRELRDVIAHDVRTSTLYARAAYDRIAVSQQYLDQAHQALDLAQTRYQLGLSSIVELSQAQLAAVEAEIQNSDARYAYQAALSELHFQTGP
jgi:outer membrane protein